jgi:dihydroflavonol-4-reductase
MTIADRPVLVTGASGFVGNNLVRCLLQQGRTVRVLVRDPVNPSLAGLNVEVVIADVLDLSSLHDAMEGMSTVFHLAGAIAIDGQHDQRMQQVNVQGTANVVSACLSTGVDRLIHFSSIHALSWFPKNQPVDERRPLALDPQKHLAYDRSKAAGEQAVLEGVQQGLDAVILNPVGIFGPEDYEPSPGGAFLRQLMRRELPGLVRAGYYWVDVRDVVNAAVVAEHQGRSGERYILNGHYATFKTIAGWVQETTGVRAPWLNVPVWTASWVAPWVAAYSRWRGVRPLVTPEAIEIVQCHQQIATDKAARELGFQPRPLRDTMFDTVDWLQRH